MTAVSHAEQERRRKISAALKGRKKGPRKPVSDDVRRKRSAAMKARWVQRTEEERAQIGARISESLTGKVQSEEHRKSNSDSHRGRTLPPEQRDEISQSLKRAYDEGRRTSKKGVPAGVPSEGTKQKISQGVRFAIAEGRASSPGGWNRGMETGPRSEATKRKISDGLRGQPHPVSPEKHEAWRGQIAASKRGVSRSAEARRKTSESLRRAYVEGRRTVSVKSGYGKGEYYDTPFQGRKWLRSTSEVQRARELDKDGGVWFYELCRFSVRMDDRVTTYTPDFWVVRGVLREDVPTEVPFDDFVARMIFPGILQIEDVKGWWGPQHKTFKKISAFQSQYPEVPFRIVIREGTTRHRRPVPSKGEQHAESV